MVDPVVVSAFEADFARLSRGPDVIVGNVDEFGFFTRLSDVARLASVIVFALRSGRIFCVFVLDDLDDCRRLSEFLRPEARAVYCDSGAVTFEVFTEALLHFRQCLRRGTLPSRIVVLLDQNTSHTAKGTKRLYRDCDFTPLWIPVGATGFLQPIDQGIAAQLRLHAAHRHRDKPTWKREPPIVAACCRVHEQMIRMNESGELVIRAWRRFFG